MPGRKARQFVHQSELKVEAIQTIIHEIVIFHPKIKIIHPAPGHGEQGFRLFEENLLIKAR